MVEERLRNCLRLSASSAKPCRLLVIGASLAQCQAVAQVWPQQGTRLHMVRLDAAATPWQRQTLNHCVDLTDWGGLENLPNSLGQFDAVWLGPDSPASEQTALARGLRRRVWRNAWLYTAGPASTGTQAAWADNGWCWSDSDLSAHAWAQPRWPLPESPTPLAQHAMVIGAGLAGAATVAQLTARGWRVDWLDSGTTTACGASALPVGMLSPHPTAQPTPMSELTNWGIAHTTDALHRHLPEQSGWCATRVDDAHGTQGRQDPAYLIEPAALVNAWAEAALRTERVRWLAQTPVARIQRMAGQWQALDTADQVQAQAPVLILANGYGSKALLNGAADALRPVAGQMSWARLHNTDTAPAPHPRRNHGVLSPDFTGSRGRLWAVGSTYRRGVNETTMSESDHDSNRDSLLRLCPSAVPRFDQQRMQGQLQAFVGVRCATPDRMPVLGAVPLTPHAWPNRGGLAAVERQTGLYVFAALGSRGLTLAAWGADTLADLIEGLPLATPAHLVQACDPARKSLRSA